MKKVLFLASLLVMVMIASTVMAYQVKTVGSYGPYQAGSGGEFTFSSTGLTGDFLAAYLPYYSALTKNQYDSDKLTSLQTFCLEGKEYTYPNTTFDVAISSNAMMGQMPPNGDPISIGTAYLYYMFSTGKLSVYNYTGTAEQRKASAQDLQNAIWALEGEGGSISSTYSTMLTGKFGNNTDAWTADNTGANASPVRVLNLTAPGSTGDAALRQDMLVTVAPVPPSVWLLGSGLVGLFGMRRKFFG